MTLEISGGGSGHTDLDLPDRGTDQSPDYHSHPLHVRHCFDYLRQSIMCSGDMTLETALVHNGQRQAGVDGWNVTHQCKDWSAILEYVEANKLPPQE